MQKVTFIIISPSYILRKGLSALIRQFDQTIIYDEIEGSEGLLPGSPHHIPDLLMLDFSGLGPGDLTRINDFVKKYDVGVIGVLAENAPPPAACKCKLLLGLHEPEEDVRHKFMLCLKSFENGQMLDNKEHVLSDRERDVLRLVAQGKINKEIADMLYISLHTVITHRKNITRKLGIKTVSGLTVYAILNNIVGLKEVG